MDILQMKEKIKEDILKEWDKHKCKRCGGSTEEGKFCEKCDVLEKEQMDFNRSKTKMQSQVQISNISRHITYKEEQVKSNTVQETRIVKIADNGEATIMDGYIDQIKPKFLLENEIDELKVRQELFKQQLKAIERAEEEDARKTTNPGN